MAWQLIYTSAPRLLEAGRTGFGTVARHRAISGMLAATVERFSQFARLPGHDPRRVVHTYRTVMVGSSTFHVFSCLRDAGSDYSGRTNHLAQHLIAEAREIRALAGSGLTPADVLLGMAWLSAWNEPPRFMDPGEEVALGSFSAVKSTAWAALTGNPDSARLLCTPSAMKGAYLICPPGLNLLELLRESLLHAPMSGWQTSFTTGLEPNDEVGDFRWIGIPAASPLRGQVETSNRTVLDLTQPAQLPAPPAPVVPEPVPERVAAPAASQAETEPAKVRLREEPPTASAASSMGGMGGWDPQPRKKAASKKNNTLIYSLVLVGLIVMAVVGYVVWKGGNEAQSKEAFERQVNQTWNDYVVPDKLARTKKEVLNQKNEDLFDSYKKYFGQVRVFLGINANKEEIHQPSDVENEITDLNNALTEWQGVDAKFKSQWDAQIKAENPEPSPTALITVFEDWSKGRKATWGKLSAIFKVGKMPPLDAEIRTGLLTEVTEYLRKKISPMRGAEPEQWGALNKLLGAPQADTGVREWLSLFSQMVNNTEESVRKKAAKKVIADKGYPQWLRHESENLFTMQAKSAPKIDPMADAKAKADAYRKAKENAPKKEDADSLEARNPIYICMPKAGGDALSLLGKEIFKMESGMHLFVGSAWDRNPLPHWLGDEDNGKLQFRLNFGSPLSSMFVFSDEGKIIHVPDNAAAVPNGYRLVARSSDDMKVLFDLRLIPAEQKNKPVLTDMLTISVTNAAEVTLTKLGALMERLHFIGLSDPQFLIRLEGAATEQKIYGLKTTLGDSAVTVMNAQQAASSPAMGNNIKALDDRIKELEAGINKDNTDLKKNEDSNNPEKIKSEKQQAYTTAKSNKEIELAQVKQQRRTLESQTTVQSSQPFFTLPPGEYTLLEKTSGNTMICKLLITAQDKAVNSKPVQP